MTVLQRITEGLLAGILIAIGGTVYLSCADKVVGAVFFSVALLCICMKGYSLFTGKVGYLPEKHGREELSVLFWGLLGNLLGTVLCGLLLSKTLSAQYGAAVLLTEGKLADQLWWQTLVRAFFCGILMYLAVSIYRENKTPAGIFFCIPVFILSGFEHSIADMFYFAMARNFTLSAALFLLLVLLGNALGGMLPPAMRLAFAKRRGKEPKEADSDARPFRDESASGESLPLGKAD